MISEAMSLNFRHDHPRINWPKTLPPDANAPYGLALLVSGVKRARFSHFGVKSICPPPVPIAAHQDVLWDFSTGLPQGMEMPGAGPDQPNTIRWSATAGKEGGGLVVPEEAWLVFPVAWPRESFVMEWDAKPHIKDKNYGAGLGFFDGRQLREPVFYNLKQDGSKLFSSDSWLRFQFLVDSRKSPALLFCTIVGRAKQGYLNEQFAPWAAFNHRVTVRLNNQYVDNFRIRPATIKELDEAEKWYESRPIEQAPKKVK
jgi:hypothetical protein